MSTYTEASLTPLAGGVSSDIYRADLPSGVACVKRALPMLRVAARWEVPVERNRSEVAWMRVAAAIVPSAVPKILGEDVEGGAFAMEWLPPERYPVWKSLLMAGDATEAMAREVGDVFGRIHAATAGRDDIAARFATAALFHALRLDPYLVAAANVNPDLAPALHRLVQVTAATRRALVHGDASPKNILIGAGGPVILDAECAWYGDPAFDVAFLVNHLLLKAAWQPARREAFRGMAHALLHAYRAHVRWEPWDALDARTAALLPGLMLARLEGKSPVEYLADHPGRHAVRAFARRRLLDPLSRVDDVLADFAP